jgi:hypothetical protein
MKQKIKRNRPQPPPSGTQEAGLVPISCPDCFGVLRFQREGSHGHLLYRCQVGHRYTVGSMLHGKEAQLEHSLWSAALLLKQMVYAYEDLLSEVKKVTGAERKRVQHRINEVRKQGLAIRAMIEATHALEQ